MDVREATTEFDPKTGAVVHTFTSGTMVQVFQLSGNVPSDSFDDGDKARSGLPCNTRYNDLLCSFGNTDIVRCYFLNMGLA
jgi:hypothetical protein